MKKIESVYKKIKFFLKEDKRSAIIWLITRLYLGYEWALAGWEKVNNSAWVGNGAGNAISGFLNGSLAKTVGAHPDVTMWYAWLIKNIFLPLSPFMSYLVAFGELFVGIALIIGFKTKKAAKIGAFMNLNYLLAGTVSINPVLLILSLILIKAKKVAGYFGLDGFLNKNN